MSIYDFEAAELKSLKGKTVLVIGAATGIGREAVKLAHSNGANVVFGDWNEECDVSKWNDVLDLFQATHQEFGTIHAVLSNAGVSRENILLEEFDATTGKLSAPNLDSLNINLVGHIYAVKCALHYFAKWPETRCQIVMTGSAASFIDTPPLYLYCAAKAGVLGLMRALRSQVIKKNITVNMVAPWMTITQMMPQQIIDVWGELPQNTCERVAEALLLPVLRPETNGKAFFIAGGKIVEVEDKLHETRRIWIGEQLSKSIDEGQRRMIP